MARGDQYFLTSAGGEKMELTGDLTVGRSADCDLVLAEGQPSRQHARLTVEAEGVFVEDLNSTNGTFVNGNRISGKQALGHGDEVAFDVNTFSFAVQAPERDDRTVLRPMVEEDPNRTVLRSVPTKEELEAELAQEAAAAQPAEEPPAAPAEPAPPPPQPKPAAASKPVKPGSWADPNEKNASSTQFFSPEDLAAMRGGSVQEKIESDVPILQVGTGSAAGSAIQLLTDGDKKEWSIGSDNARDIVFTDQGVSLFHTILAFENGRWKLVDQMSTNGTFVNGSKAVSAYLNSGDTIRIGTVECTFVLPGGMAGKQAGSATGGGGGGGSKAVISVAAFVAVLALMFGAYFFLM